MPAAHSRREEEPARSSDDEAAPVSSEDLKKALDALRAEREKHRERVLEAADKLQKIAQS